MVSLWWLAERLQAVQQQPAIQRLDDQTRARLLAALAGLLILGLALMALAWLGARWAQHYRGAHDPWRDRRTAPNPDDWAAKPLVPREPRRRTTNGGPRGASSDPAADPDANPPDGDRNGGEHG